MKTAQSRRDRAARYALLRNPPTVKPQHKSEAIAIMAELALIHNNSALDGVTKHKLFVRGANQLSKLA